MSADVDPNTVAPGETRDRRLSSLDTDPSIFGTERDAVHRVARACQVIAGQLGASDPLVLRAQLLPLRSLLPRRVIVAQVVAEHLLMTLALTLRRCLPAWRLEHDGQLLAILRNPAPEAARQLLEFGLELLDREGSSTTRRPAPTPEVEAKLHRVLEGIRTGCAGRTCTLQAAAAGVGLTRWHLDRLLTRHTGHSFVHHARVARLAAAQALLADTFKSIKEVSAASGYNSVTHFDRDFRRQLGCSPRAWRARHAQELLTDSKK